MTYFNKKIYNYKNLHVEDKRLVNFYDAAIEDLESAIECSLFDIYEETTMDKIKKEICEEFSKNIMEFMDSSRLELLVSIIDDYDEEVEEREDEE